MDQINRMLYRSLRRAIAGFDRNGLPCTDVVGSNMPAVLEPAQLLQYNFRTQPSTPSTLRDLSQVVNTLERQKNVLLGADEHTRWAMSCWAIHLKRCSHAITSSPWGYALSLEATSFLTALLTKIPLSPLDEDELQEGLQTAHAQVHHTRDKLDSIAVEVAQQCSLTGALQGPGGPSRGPVEVPPVGDVTLEAAHAAAAVDACWGGIASTEIVQQNDNRDVRRTAEHFQELHKALFISGLSNHWRLRQKPYEWVYDGLKPLCITDVVTDGQGVSLTLGSITVAVARRLGIQLQMIGAADTVLGTAEGPSQVPNMPEYVAIRQAGRAALIQPDLETCLVVWRGATSKQNGATSVAGGSIANDALLAFNPVRPSVLLDAAACNAKYPAVSLESTTAASQVLAAASMHCRVAMTAYQRRGESDTVAHWLYQLLALDPGAPEWAQALLPG